MFLKAYPLALRIAALPFGASAADSQVSEIVVTAVCNKGQAAHVQESQIDGMKANIESAAGLFDSVFHRFQQREPI